MKKLLIVLAILPFFAFQCDKTNTQKCIKGKVIRITCASYVIQVLDNTELGDDQWKDSMGDGAVVYDNVFNAANKCKIPASYKTGDIIYFSIGAAKPSDCVVCMMYDAPPKTQFEVTNISLTPCE